jgi:hypothetical protein
MTSTSNLPPMSEHQTHSEPTPPALLDAVPLLYTMRAPAPGYDWACWACGKSWRGSKPNLPPPGRCPKCKSPRWWWRPFKATPAEVRWQEQREQRVRRVVMEARDIGFGVPASPPPMQLPVLSPPPFMRLDPAPENQIDAAQEIIHPPPLRETLEPTNETIGPEGETEPPLPETEHESYEQTKVQAQEENDTPAGEVG